MIARGTAAPFSKGEPVKKRMTLHRETLCALDYTSQELRQAIGVQSATCQIPSICKSCYTHIGYPTCK